MAIVIGDKLIEKHGSVGTYDSSAKVEFESRLAHLDEAVVNEILKNQCRTFAESLWQ